MEFINVKLSDIGEVVGGSTPSTKNPYNYDGNIAWITPKDLAGYNKVYISRGERNITEAGFKSCSTKMLPKNSVLFSSRAPIGYVAISENDLCTNQGFKSIIPNEKVDYKFLYYLLKHNKDYIASKGSGSTFKEVSGSVMKGIELSIPKNINDQRKISKVLFDIDKKIELNNEINNNLYRIIDSIYKNNILDKFEKNHKLSELYYFQYGKGNNNPDNNGIYPVYGSNGIIGGYTEFNNEESPVIGHIGANCGSLIFAFGKHFVTYNGVMCIINNEMYRYFGYVTMRFLNFRNEIRGSSQPFVSYDLLNNMNIPLPDSKVILECEKMFKPVFNIIRNNNNQNCDLEQLRDTLLPKLMNGEIDLDNIEI